MSDDTWHATSWLHSTLDKFSAHENLTYDLERGRITYVEAGLAVTLIVVATKVQPRGAVFASGCPFCGSQRPPNVRDQDGFEPQRGCLDCDKWWDPVRLKKP